MSHLLMTPRDRVRLAYALRDLHEVEGIARYRFLRMKMGATVGISFEELARISDAIYPEPLRSIIVDSELRVTEA